jgi:hypothetical protein
MIAAIRKIFTGREAIHGARADLEALREIVEERRAELARIAAAPVPPAEAMAGFEAWIDRTATAAVDRLRLGELLRDGGRTGLALPTRRIVGADGAISADLGPAVDVLFGLLLATSRERVLALVSGQLADLAAGGGPIASADRPARIAEAEAALLAAEIEEEAAVRALEDAGVAVARRPDADPRAVLAMLA